MIKLIRYTFYCKLLIFMKFNQTGITQTYKLRYIIQISIFFLIQSTFIADVCLYVFYRITECQESGYAPIDFKVGRILNKNLCGVFPKYPYLRNSRLRNTIIYQCNLSTNCAAYLDKFTLSYCKSHVSSVEMNRYIRHTRCRY